MKKLDRLEWNYGFSESSFGVDFAIRTEDRSLVQRVKQRQRILCVPSKKSKVDRMFSLVSGGRRGNTRLYNLLYCNHALLARSFDLDAVLTRLDELIYLSVAELSKEKTFLHAGVVAWEDKAIVLPGKSFSGKSTLVSELVRRGAEYFSDEYAVLDDQGHVSPHAKPLTLRESAVFGSDRQIKAAPALHRSLPVSMIIGTGYKKDAKWRPKKLSKGQTLLFLLQNSFSAQREPRFTMDRLEKFAEGADSFRTLRGEAAETADRILERLEQTPH